MQMPSFPEGNDYTFWGRGVSQGHSDAIRRVEGVLDAKQYTAVPVQSALDAVKDCKKTQPFQHAKNIQENAMLF